MKIKFYKKNMNNMNKNYTKIKINYNNKNKKYNNYKFLLRLSKKK